MIQFLKQSITYGSAVARLASAKRNAFLRGANIVQTMKLGVGMSRVLIFNATITFQKPMMR